MKYRRDLENGNNSQQLLEAINQGTGQLHTGTLNRDTLDRGVTENVQSHSVINFAPLIQFDQSCLTDNPA
jgi:hypothetical protein